jgi:hypothetical protein
MIVDEGFFVLGKEGETKTGEKAKDRKDGRDRKDLCP